MDKDRILRLCNEIEDIATEIKERTMKDSYFMAQTIINKVLVIAAEINEPPKTNGDTEVRHGRWIEETEPDENGNVVAMCNQCYHTDEHGVNMKIPYCWYCGARMTRVNGNE